MNDYEKQVFRSAISKYGEINQIVLAIAEEMADAGIMLDQLSIMEQNVADVIFAALGMIGEHMETVEQIISENARLSKINTELESQMRRMVANQCKCDCDWRNQE